MAHGQAGQSAKWERKSNGFNFKNHNGTININDVENAAAYFKDSLTNKTMFNMFVISCRATDKCPSDHGTRRFTLQPAACLRYNITQCKQHRCASPSLYSGSSSEKKQRQRIRPTHIGGTPDDFQPCFFMPPPAGCHPSSPQASYPSHQ